MRSLVSLVIVASAAALNIVSHGGNTVRRAAKRTEPVALPTDKLADAFKAFDTDGNGSLDASELQAAFEAVGHPVSEGVLKHSFSLIDTNKDGKIDLEEFKAMAQQNLIPTLAQMFMKDNGRTFEANEDSFSSNAQRIRDEKLVMDDTRRFCLDRCLSTGHCDVLEDFLEMSTMQVRKFCESCSSGDECTLEYA